jgi:hypothetical protein
VQSSEAAALSQKEVLDNLKRQLDYWKTLLQVPYPLAL